MTTTTKLMTADELLRMPDDNQRHELVRGELRTMPPSGYEHGGIVVNITGPLHQFVRSKKLGKVFGAETGFVLERSPDTVLAPDVSYVSKLRLSEARSKKGFFPGPPDLAVEVMSPSDTIKHTEQKAKDWVEGGTALVWVVDPKRETVTVYEEGAEPVVVGIDDELDGGEILEGFTLPVREIFAED